MSYRGGQQPIVHLQSDLNTVIQWANSNKVRWAFSNGNVGARLTIFYNHPSKLGEIDWSAVASIDFRDAKVKEGKQAEFLMFDVFPWTLIEKIGTINSAMAAKVQTVLANIGHQPLVAIEPAGWFHTLKEFCIRPLNPPKLGDFRLLAPPKLGVGGQVQGF